jgi:hypothetical protein
LRILAIAIQGTEFCPGNWPRSKSAVENLVDLPGGPSSAGPKPATRKGPKPSSSVAAQQLTGLHQGEASIREALQ